MKAPPLPLWRMTRVRYDRLVDVGMFGPEDRGELLDGLLVAREPQGRRHAAVVVLVRAALEKAFGSAYHVREEKPIALDEQSEPEPDAVVVPGQPSSTSSTRCWRCIASRCAPRRDTGTGSTIRSVCSGATPSSRRSTRPEPASASP